MERLLFEGNFCDIAQCDVIPGGSSCESGSFTQRKVWERLKAYEDTGLTPELVQETAELAIWVHDNGIEKIKEWIKADKDGRLMVLPCKVGDTVYFALLGKIIEKQVFSIVAFSNSTRIYCDGTSEYFRPEDIGKTVFLTREEAETLRRKHDDKENS